MRRWIVLALLVVAPGCGDPDGTNDGPIAVSVIGPRPSLLDPSQKPVPAPAAVLLSAVSQGLVRFDASGQIEPGLAIRWDVSDDGLYYIFRLGADAGLDADAVARRLRSAIGPTSRNPLRRELAAIVQVIAVTPEVIEIRLSAPRPDLLQLLAQPDLTMIGDVDGDGPFRIADRDAGTIRLVPANADAPTVDGADPEPPAVDREILLRGDRAAIAAARFRRGEAGLVLGGRFLDIALARIADPGGRALRLDPAQGLFGLEVVDPRGLLSAPENRRALAMAIDRDRIVRSFADGWAARTGLVAAGADDLATPTEPAWTALDLVARADLAARTIAAWRAVNDAPPPLRVAIPDGAGARLLFTLVAIDWQRIGVAAVAVAMDEAADLRLVDAVAPTGGAAWYLHRFTCDRAPSCSEMADQALAAARAAPDLARRSAQLAEADRRLAEVVAFIPIASPLRWSLVAPNLQGYRDNPRAIHALDQVRDDR